MQLGDAFPLSRVQETQVILDTMNYMLMGHNALLFN